jgi:hypothetical protein
MKHTAMHLPTHALPFVRGVEQGYDVDIRTPLFDGRDRAEVADEWEGILVKEASSVYTDFFPELLDVELNQRQKIGPLSIRLPFKDRVADVLSYYNSGKEVIEDPSEFPIFDRLQVLSRKRLRPTDYESSANRLPHDTNSGLPLFKRRSSVKTESIAMAKEGALHPALLGWRGQSNGTDVPKQRVVWMFPYSTNIMEGRFFQPVHEMLLKYTTNFAAWIGMDEVDVRVTDMFNLDMGILSSDFSAYDQTLGAQQTWYFDLLRNWFQETSYGDISLLEDNLRNIPIVCTEDVTYTGAHGMPSGSNLTNQVDSIVNLLCQASSPVVDLDHWTYVQIQGDDALVPTNDWEGHVLHLNSCGFNANPDKQVYSSDIAHYLQRVYHRKYRVDGLCRGVYPTMRALNSLLGQERFYTGWSADMVSMRAVMILENTKWHPAFGKFVDFVARKGDKQLPEFARRLTDPQFERKVVKEANSIAGLVPTYNQEGRTSGIGSFETVRILTSL